MEHGLPRPEVQYTVTHAAGTFRLDLAYPVERVAIEYDGVGHLARDRWEADHGRQNLVVLDGLDGAALHVGSSAGCTSANPSASCARSGPPWSAPGAGA